MIPTIPTTPRPSQRGFTLIELTVALAVVGILATLGWSGYSHHVQKARRAEGRAALLQALLQQERQYSYRHSYRAFTPGDSEFKWYSGDRPDTSAYSIAAQACEGEDLRSCVQLVATPGGTLVNTAHADPQCGALYADTRGRRSAQVDNGAGCW